MATAVSTTGRDGRRRVAAHAPMKRFSAVGAVCGGASATTGAVATAALTDVPQPPQNFSPGLVGVAQEGQTVMLGRVASVVTMGLFRE